MSEYRIEKDMNIVKLLVAQASGQRVESDKAEEANQKIQSLLGELTPHNKYLIGELIKFGLVGVGQNMPNLLGEIADLKRIPFGGKGSFKVPQGRIKAVIQAKGATTPRSRMADKSIVLDTVSVSARPSINIIELKTGDKNFAEFIRNAHYEMELVKLGHVLATLQNAVTSYDKPFYGEGAGLVQATLDEMLTHFRRQGNVALLGDPAITDKLALLTGFTANGNYAGQIIEDYHRNGVIGSYRGAKVGMMQNPVSPDGVTPLVSPAFLYILQMGLNKDARNLKVLEEGDPIVTEATNIDDLSFDVRIDQLFNAAYIVGNQPSMGVYKDNTL